MNIESAFGWILIIMFAILIYIFMIDYKNCSSEHFMRDYYYLDWSDPTMMSIINRENYWMANSVSCNYTDDAFFWCLNGYDVPGYENGRLRAHST